MPATRARYQLSEATSAFPGGKPRVDRAKGIVYDVKVLGLKSRNGRRYLPAAVREAVGRFEGKPVYINHPEGKSNARRYEDRFGRLHGVYVDSGGELRAKEMRIKLAHPLTESFFWDAENDPNGIGLSINADGRGYEERDGVVIDEIPEVYSVDLVDTPATTRGLFESYTPRRITEGAMDETTPLVDPAAPDITTPDPVAGDPPADLGGGGGDDHKTHLVDAATALLNGLKDGSMTMEDVKKNITDLLKMIDGGSGDGGMGGGAPLGDLTEEDDADDKPKDKGDKEYPDDLKDDDETKVLEQLRRTPSKAARWAARKLDAVRVRERLDRRRKLAVDAKLPTFALTEQFVADLADAPSDDRARKMVEDRRRLLEQSRGPKAAPAGAGQHKPTDLREVAKSFWTNNAE